MKVAILTSDARETFRDYDPPMPRFGTAPAALLDGFAGRSDVDVHVISCLQRRVSSPHKLASNIEFHALEVPKMGWLRTAYSGCIRAVRQKLKRLQPDVVHGQGTERDCGLCTVFSGVPNLLTIHGNMRLIAQVTQARPLTFNWLSARLERFTLPRVGGVLCITRYTRDAVARLARRTWVVPNAVDPTFFELSPRGPATPTILVVGHVDVRKNQNAFIRALDSLASARPLKLVFLGQASAETSYGGEFHRLLKERPWCVFPGFIDREATKRWFEQATMLALPTREDNCPMVVLEAMAAGLPVLASNVGGIPDLIEDDVTGLFCDPSRPETFLAGVQRVLDNPDFARRIASQARETARRRFHPTVIAARHLDVYRELLDAWSQAKREQ